MGRIFCRACGAKLDFSALDRAPAGTRRPAALGFHPRGAIRALGAIVAAAAVLCLILALWPVSAMCRGDLSPGKAASCRNKLSELENALEEGKPAAIWFDENEINSYLAALISARRFRLPVAPYRRIWVEGIVLDLTAGGFRITAQVSWGPLRATLRLAGTPGGTADEPALVVKSFSVGRLPLPTRWATTAVRTLRGNSGELETVHRILENLTVIRLEDHRILCGV